MIFGVGIDLCDAGRLEKSLAKQSFLDHVFAPSEQALLASLGEKRRAETAAANFAAKEAFLKAAGTGLGGFAMPELAVLRQKSGAPYFALTGAAAAWVKKTLNAHRRVIFNGNGYSEAWEAEAERRGLPNRKCTPDAMIALKDEKNIALMEEFGVLTKTEMLSRYEVEMEHYSKILNIEARTMLKIANKQLIPAATAYMGEVASAAAAKTAAVEGISTKAETKVLTALSKYTDEMSDATDALQAATDKVSAMDDEAAKAHAFHDEVIPAMDALRAAADEAESIVDEDYWPLPCYSRMLFYTE